MSGSTRTLPVLDVAPLRALGESDPGSDPQVAALAEDLRRACRDNGFFYIVGHGIDPELVAQLQQVARRFFALPQAEKQRIAMRHGGRAWRGYFGLGDELTSGKPDWKEGLYFGAELSSDDPRVAGGTPMHGRNLFPQEPAAMRAVVLAYLSSLSELGNVLMRGFALGLGLPADAFRSHLTADPLILFRIFHYPEMGGEQREQALWSVGEHTDYGLLTILLQDDVGGLEVKDRQSGEWIPAPPIEGSFVCNLGDMLERTTGGFYRSTPHRVLNRTGRSRFSFPFFFDPGWDTSMVPLDPSTAARAAAETDAVYQRWDGRSVHAFEGTYGEYLMEKVGKVFPDLADGLETPQG